MVAIPLWRCAEAEGGESRPRHEHRSWLTTKRPVLRQMPRGGAVSPGAGLSQGGGSIDLPSPVVGRGLDSSSVSVGRSVGRGGRSLARESERTQEEERGGGRRAAEDQINEQVRNKSHNGVGETGLSETGTPQTGQSNGHQLGGVGTWAMSGQAAAWLQDSLADEDEGMEAAVAGGRGARRTE